MFRVREGEKGFTMLEMLVVMGILALVGGFALFVSMETYRGSNFRSDRDLLVATLERARAQAMNNVCVGTCTDGKPHGVHIQSDEYVLFQGSAYDVSDSTNSTFASNTNVTKNPATLDIVFSQLSGTTSAKSITLSSGQGTSTISVESSGRIIWTN